MIWPVISHSAAAEVTTCPLFSHRSGTRALDDLTKHGQSLCLLLLLMYAQHSTAFLPQTGCDIYNIKYIFGLHPYFWHRVPKIFGISCGERDKGDFCYINEVTFRPAPKNGGSLTVGTFIPTSRPLERGEGLEAEINCPCPMISSIMPMIEASVKTQKVGFRELQGWWTRGTVGRMVRSQQGWWTRGTVGRTVHSQRAVCSELHTPSPDLVLCLLPIWLFLSYILL